MNLEKIKELEELTEELRKYGKQYEALSSTRRHNYIVNTEKEFIYFFKEKGFSVNESDKELKASYGSSKITMGKYNEDEWYAGCEAVWIMECSINKSKYRILLIDPNSQFKMTYSSNKKLTEDEKINKEIDKMKETIEKRKKDIEEFVECGLIYRLINESSNDEAKEFENIKELLESLFN